MLLDPSRAPLETSEVVRELDIDIKMYITWNVTDHKEFFFLNSVAKQCSSCGCLLLLTLP